MSGKHLLHREPLGTPHRGIALAHNSNPVVFLEIQFPKSEKVTVAGVQQQSQPVRLLFELFFDLAPTLATNMYGLCIGSCTRLVNHRVQAAGYKDTVLHDAFVGQYVVGGDVMGAAGSGFFSALGERQGPLQVPQNELESLSKMAPERCRQQLGIYLQYWNHTQQPEGGAPSTAKVASTFRIDTVARGAAAKMSDDGVLIGRLVARDAEQRAVAERQLAELARSVYHARRVGSPQEQSQLFPVITLCGEM
ncbi:uncharacterized protein TEOVI_000250100 [Trypanosoma equiperdum]|uniref:PPIase cyclophilin-type domain-containing protein n=3 Tax=Trypanozoon TaxID=39700 RepID=Q57YM9_TRYB2|nr:hypothetical protein, conserved [Trypanosoma brucei brucei TREU927]AAX69315.1 hypothetical protein, conserved [Trypanosoma brucei]AAZ13392.1 hypothetical protein, conserved [Trypanosoma brucei brucei TREU927]RHW72982.1 hypothetical protein DPX39_040054700 [Trypanosoma brucei equiperdum]SCU70926.1 hypothetical protein, conserved [Trypanosoma equiperdum]